MKVKIISSVFAITLAGIFMTALALSQPDEPVYSTPPEITPPPSAAMKAVDPEGFWVCAINDTVVVFHSTNRETPVETTTIALNTLRLNDQDMLRMGVFFEDYMDVVRFLEDFAP